MATCHDVAAYLLEKMGQTTTLKLQKLVYYCQAWSLVWDDKPLFDEKIEAWANGPVIPDLFHSHKGLFFISRENFSRGDPQNLTDDEKETIDIIIQDYGDKSAQWLVELTHLEDPWKESRSEYPDSAKCGNEITHASMAEYYSGLLD